MSTLTAPPIPTSPTTRAQVGPPCPRPKTYGFDPSNYRFTVAQYKRMVELGILGPDDKVELLEGYVVYKMSRDPAHDSAIQRVLRTLLRFLPPEWDVRIQMAIELSDSKPEPDLAIVKGDYSTYKARHPNPSDIGLVLEVANTSLDRDIQEKSQIYARSNVGAYWVIDVNNGLIHVFTNPSGPTAAPAYANHAEIRPPGTVVLTLDGVAVGPIPATDLLP
jgi:Uma2 family endonuclease